jgi:ProP effector
MPKRQRSTYEDIGNLLADLCAEFPNCFKPRKERPLPIKIGLYHDLKERLGQSVPDDLLRNGLSAYCNRPAYLQALWRDGAERVDLDGKPCGAVDRSAIRAMPQGKRPDTPRPPAAKPKPKGKKAKQKEVI